MLEVKNIDLFYGASQALKDVSVTAEKGQVTCVLGRNGVGKTSLMRAVAGHQTISNGSVTWQGEDISKLTPEARAKRGIAFVPQGREIFSQLTVMENLKTGFAALPRYQRRVPDYIFDLFPVLKQMLKRRGGDLSGGQQQQLAIARALVTNPQLLILDEPTEGIQPSIIKDIGNVIDRLRTHGIPSDGKSEDVAQIQSAIGKLKQEGQMAILLVEQFFEFARDLADQYSVMDRGEVVLSGLGHEMVESEVRSWMTV